MQWDRCARLATPSSRQSVDKLHLIGQVFANRPATGAVPPGQPATNSEPFAGTLVGRAVRALIAIAAVQVAAALILLPWAWDGYRQEYGDLAFFVVALLLGNTASACLFLFGGRRDERTRLLGVFFILSATLASPFGFLGVIWGLPRDQLFGYPYVYPFMFAPAFLWAFARECPRVHRVTRLDDLARSHGSNQRSGGLRHLDSVRGVAGALAGGLHGSSGFLGDL